MNPLKTFHAIILSLTLQTPLVAQANLATKIKGRAPLKLDDITFEDMALIGGTGFLMAELLGTCPHKHDVWVFLASGGYLLASELANDKNFRFNSDEIEKDIKRLKDDQDKQIAALEGAAKITKNAASAARTRSQNYQTAAIGFGLASATAVTL